MIHYSGIPQIAQQRLQNQAISQPADSPEAVVRWMGALQAQDYHQAVWAVGLRLRAAVISQVEQAIEEGRILRTWPMRGTIHFVAPEDARWMLRLSATRMMAKSQTRLKQLELDSETLVRCQSIFYEALKDGAVLTRHEMLSRLEQAGIIITGQRGYHILVQSALNGVICIGPTRDKEQTFVLLDHWAPHPRSVAPDEALAELAGRYFASHGPATVQDFSWWAGLTLTDARAGLEAVKSQLIAEKVDGKEYWRSAQSADKPAVDESRIHLLAGYDEYLLGYSDRRAVLDPQHAGKVSPGANGVFYPMIVINGQIVGTWKRIIKKRGVVVSPMPFEQLSDEEHQAFESAAQRYAAFCQLPLQRE